MRRMMVVLCALALAAGPTPAAASQPLSSFHLVGPVVAGGSFAFDAPCAVSPGHELQVQLSPQLPLPYYAVLRFPGPIAVGARLVDRLPVDDAGPWHARVDCPTGERFETLFHLEPADGGPGPAPRPQLAPVRSRAEVVWGPSMLGHHLAAEIVAIGAGNTDTGYVLAAADGGVFTYGRAAFRGSAADLPLQAPVVDVAIHPQSGYWLLGADGGVFAFGDAPFLGSAAPLRHRSPFVAVVPTRSGAGYWLVAADGGVFAFGDAPFHGRPTRGAAPIADAAPFADGYVLAGDDGDVHAFGAPHLGDAAGGFGRRDPVVAIVADAGGYRLFTASGDSVAFGAEAPPGTQARDFRWFLDAAPDVGPGGISTALVLR